MDRMINIGNPTASKRSSAFFPRFDGRTPIAASTNIASTAAAPREKYVTTYAEGIIPPAEREREKGEQAAGLAGDSITASCHARRLLDRKRICVTYYIYV